MADSRLSQSSAAEQLGVTEATLANWRWRKYGPPFLKVGRRIEYVQRDIDEWRDAQRRDPQSATS
jgi:hypothetical protein